MARFPLDLRPDPPPDPPPAPAPLATDDAAREIASLVLEGTDATIGAARALAEVLTVTQLRALTATFDDARRLTVRARDRRLDDALREG